MTKKKEEPYILIMKTKGGVAVEAVGLCEEEAVGMMEIAKISYIRGTTHSFEVKDKKKTLN